MRLIRQEVCGVWITITCFSVPMYVHVQISPCANKKDLKTCGRGLEPKEIYLESGLGHDKFDHLL